MPRFETTIPTHGPHGNVFAILGNATSLMRQLGIPKKDIAELRGQVTNAKTYDEACDAVREWFPVGTDEDI